MCTHTSTAIIEVTQVRGVRVQCVWVKEIGDVTHSESKSRRDSPFFVSLVFHLAILYKTYKHGI